MTRLIRDDIDKFFEYGLDISTKTLYIGSLDSDWEGNESGVDHSMAEHAVKGLHILDRKVTDGLTIIMNNVGGDWYHGMAIYDAIKACQNHVTIKVFGHAMSMGSIILQAADERLVSPNSRFMVHYGTSGYHGHNQNFLKWAEEERELNKIMEEIYLDKIRQKKPRFSRRHLKELLNFDSFLSPTQAIEYNLADKIL